jgi:hypothetical protein
MLKINIGHPTKELLEGEWIANMETWHNIETPKALKRVDLTKNIA